MEVSASRSICAAWALGKAATRLAAENLRKADYSLDPSPNLDTHFAVRANPVLSEIQHDEIKKNPVEEAELEDLPTEAREKDPGPWGFVASGTRGGHHR